LKCIKAECGNGICEDEEDICSCRADCVDAAGISLCDQYGICCCEENESCQNGNCIFNPNYKKSKNVELTKKSNNTDDSSLIIFSLSLLLILFGLLLIKKSKK
jgi:hypothetical protein